jgi:hypothetical protein
LCNEGVLERNRFISLHLLYPWNCHYWMKGEIWKKDG